MDFPHSSHWWSVAGMMPAFRRCDALCSSRPVSLVKAASQPSYKYNGILEIHLDVFHLIQRMAATFPVVCGNGSKFWPR